jgi:hypothetical protein
MCSLSSLLPDTTARHIVPGSSTKAPPRPRSGTGICLGTRVCRRTTLANSDLADDYVEINRQAEKKRGLLRGRTIINYFFENSTPTRTSFEVAGNGSAATSSTCRYRQARWSRARP